MLLTPAIDMMVDVIVWFSQMNPLINRGYACVVRSAVQLRHTHITRHTEVVYKVELKSPLFST